MVGLSGLRFEVRVWGLGFGGGDGGSVFVVGLWGLVYGV